MSAAVEQVPTAPGAGRPETLRLVSVLASGLPRELGTPDEPSRYTVPAVFSRQVTPRERARIEDPETARLLSQHGSSDLALAVSDRRLLIKNTTLAQLQGGLAAALAATLRDIDSDLNAQRDELAARAQERDSDERARAAAIMAAAGAIHFD